MWIFSVFFVFQMVDINQASLEQLMTLDGVGQKMAEKMMDHRNQKGGFASLEDLLLIQGMKPKLFNKLSKQVLIGKRSKLPQKSADSVLMSDEALENLLKNDPAEPGVREVQEEALKYANAHPEQIRSWLSRARKAYWLPKVQTAVEPHFGHLDSMRDKVGDSDIFTNRQARDWRFQLKAEWHFHNLIFNRDEILLGQQFLRQSLLRERILNRINESYFERQRLKIQKKTNSYENNSAKIEAAIQIQALTAELDGLTGGWFSAKNAYSH